MLRYPVDEAGQELKRIRREQGSSDRMWPIQQPKALYDADRHAKAAHLMFVTLSAHYFDCLATGRMETWRRAASSAVELLASVPDVPFEHHL